MGATCAAAGVPAVAAGRFVTDGAGRRVAVPSNVERVFPAGPPAAIQIYTLAPATLIGWPRANRADEREFLLARLLPACALLGGGYVLLIDTLARTMAPIEIPLGILTAVIGTPFFIWLLAGMQRTWSS